jgi:tRNA threonylcarbamoyladenosine biosynthesis protein TsaB
MKLLGFDTSTEACAVGVLADGRCFSRVELTPRRHTECVLPWSDDLLAEAGLRKTQLDAIAVGIGPGAFTGVRLAVSLAQGLALGLDIPVLGVSTLACIAQSSAHDGPIAVLMDARMGECYVGFYQKQQGIVAALAPEQLLSPETLSLPWAGDWIALGSGLSSYADRLPADVLGQFTHTDSTALPQAHALLQIAAHDFSAGLARAPEHVEPAYLRDKVALTIDERAGLA